MGDRFSLHKTARLHFLAFAVWTLSFSTSVFAQTRVACVGDSITEGYGLAQPDVDAYPAKLQALLGANYAVRNFGVSGTTALKESDKAYWDERGYSQSTEFAPEIVLLMLGTNDSKAFNWNESAFRNDYAELVEHYQALNARVVVGVPPKVFGEGAFGIDPAIANDVMVPIVHGLASELDVPLVDVFEATKDHAEWFSDLIHPSADGAAAIASAFAVGVVALDQVGTTEEPVTTASSEATSAASETADSSSTRDIETTSTAPLSRPSNESTGGESSDDSTALSGPQPSSTSDTSSRPQNATLPTPTSSDTASAQPTDGATSPGRADSTTLTPTTADSPLTMASSTSIASTSTPSTTASRSQSGCGVVVSTKSRGSSSVCIGLWLLGCLGFARSRQRLRSA